MVSASSIPSTVFKDPPQRLSSPHPNNNPRGQETLVYPVAKHGGSPAPSGPSLLIETNSVQAVVDTDLKWGRHFFPVAIGGLSFIPSSSGGILEYIRRVER